MLPRPSLHPPPRPPQDYVDAEGNLKEDIALPDGAKDGKKKAGAPAGDGGEGGDGGAAAPPKKRRRTGGKRGGGGGPPPTGGAPAAAGGGGGVFGFFGSGLSNFTMADVKKLLGGGGGAAAAPVPLGGPTVGGAAGVPLPGLGGGAAAPDRGVTTGFLGSLPGGGAAAAAGAPPGSAFAAAAGLAGAPPPLAAALPLAAPLQLSGGLAPAAVAPAAPGAGWQDASLAAFRPAIESQLGAGRALAQVVDPPSAPPAGAPGSLVKGVVYCEAPGGGGAGAPGGPGATYGAALWDGSRLVDHGARVRSCVCGGAAVGALRPPGGKVALCRQRRRC
jgi:collagen type IV alpha